MYRLKHRRRELAVFRRPPSLNTKMLCGSSATWTCVLGPANQSRRLPNVQDELSDYSVAWKFGMLGSIATIVHQEPVSKVIMIFKSAQHPEPCEALFGNTAPA